MWATGGATNPRTTAAPNSGVMDLTALSRYTPAATPHGARLVARSAHSYARALYGWPTGLRSGIRHPATLVRGVAVTVCGFGDSAATWSRLHRGLLADGLAVVPVVWNPLSSSLADLIDRVVAAVDAAVSDTGMNRVHLIGHSIGGVMARRAVQHGALRGRVASVTTLACPHRGMPLTKVARRWVPLATELDRIATRVDACDRDPAGAAWTAVAVADDLIVPPGRQTLLEIPAATNVSVSGTDHLGVLHHQRAIATVLAATAPTTDGVSPAAEALVA